MTRLLSLHDGVKVEVLTATDRNAGQPFKNIYPQFSYLSGLPLLTKWEVIMFFLQGVFTSILLISIVFIYRDGIRQKWWISLYP